MAETRTPPANPCIYKICPMHKNICRIRFDFFSFQIAQPAFSGNCNDDSFVITAPDGGGTPVFCGTISLNTVWVDSDGSECSEAVLSYSPSKDERRFYRIRARQYDCNNEYLAGPKGCLQYFTNFTHNNGREFQEAFSFNGPWMDPAERHLANQDYNLCWRREPGMCYLCLRFSYVGNSGLSQPANVPANLANADSTPEDPGSGTFDLNLNTDYCT